jgi:ribose 5-phosphate isomerase RpiB
MSVADIQNFLVDILDGTAGNGANVACDTGGNKPYYGTYAGVYHNGNILRKNLDPNFPPPYICMKDYYENETTHENNLTKADKVASPIPAGAVSAAQIIYDAAQTYGINPRVLIVMIQKESLGPLLTDDWPWYTQYKVPMGYACPDGQPCDTAYYGFYNQVTSAAHQFRYDFKYPADTNYPIGANNIKYYPNTTCGTKAVNIINQATSSLYKYTPYTPNPAALTNLYTTGDSCSSYGNRNFWRLFTDWFGSTLYHGNDPLGSFDIIQQNPGSIRLAGWGFDRSLNGPANIHVYVDGVGTGILSAGNPRPDVQAAYAGAPLNSGYDGTVAYNKSGTHQVCAWVVGDSLGAPNYGMGCKSIVFNSDPLGVVNIVQQNPGTLRLAGWGFDRSLNGPANIHVYIDGIGQGIIATANPRPDVQSIYPAAGPNAGYDGTVPFTKSGTHQVCTWVVGDGYGAGNYGMGCNSFSINNDPIGVFDFTQPVSGGVRLAGWGFDRSLNGPANIHVYIDGVGAGIINAGNSRPDVGTVYPGNGDNHGFDGTLPYSTPGTHQVCAWVVGDNLGAGNYGLGCKKLSL